MNENPEQWRRIASRQRGLITLPQLRASGVRARVVERRVRSERWQRASSSVVAVTTGELSPDQQLWLGVLHAGSGSAVGGIHALELAGLKQWSRPTITIFVPYSADVPEPLPGFAFIRTRRDLSAMTSCSVALPTCRVEPAALLFASRERSERSAQGILAAVIQQGLTTPLALSAWLERLKPLRRAALFRASLNEIAGGSQSVAELDIRRACRRFGLAMPVRQVKRRDADGRLRYTDCEWRLADGRTLILEIDGMFHMSVQQWEHDLSRQRALSRPDVIIVHCTSREIRDEPERIIRDLRRLGVPAAA